VSTYLILLEKEDLSTKNNDVPLSLMIRIENEDNDEETPQNLQSNIRLASCAGFLPNHDRPLHLLAKQANLLSGEKRVLKDDLSLGYSPFQYDDVDSSEVKRQNFHTLNNDLQLLKMNS